MKQEEAKSGFVILEKVGKVASLIRFASGNDSTTTINLYLLFTVHPFCTFLP